MRETSWTPSRPASSSRRTPAAALTRPMRIHEGQPRRRDIIRSQARGHVARLRGAGAIHCRHHFGLLLERVTPEDLLGGDHALWTTAAEKGHSPVEERRDPVLEPGEPDDVHDQPEQPRAEAGALDPADHRERTEPRDGGHGPEVAVLERPPLRVP